MGWSSGTELFDRVIAAVMPALNWHCHDDDDAENTYREIIDAFLDNDWDGCSESEYYDHYIIGRLLGNEGCVDGS